MTDRKPVEFSISLLQRFRRPEHIRSAFPFVKFHQAARLVYGSFFMFHREALGEIS